MERWNRQFSCSTLPLRSESKAIHSQPSQAGTAIQHPSNLKAAWPGKSKKQQEQHLELSALLTANINSEASDDPQKKREETEDQEKPAQCFTAQTAVSSEDTHRIPEVSLPQG